MYQVWTEADGIEEIVSTHSDNNFKFEKNDSFSPFTFPQPQRKVTIRLPFLP
jgi:hypothetical protein